MGVDAADADDAGRDRGDGEGRALVLLGSFVVGIVDGNGE